jgi:cytochrome c oxidase assembly factor CtaG/putative copper export protein
VVTLAAALLAAVLLPPGAPGPRPDPVRRLALRWAGTGAVAAAASTALHVVLSRSEVLGLSPAEAAAPAGLARYLATDRQGVALGLQLLLCLLAQAAARRGSAGSAVVASTTALLPPVLVGHAVGLDSPGLSGSLIAAHVVGAAGWVAGLLAVGRLARVAPDRLPGTLPRYSALATGCLVLVAGTGLLTGLLRVGGPDGLGSGYAALVLVKVGLFLVVAELGRRNRSAARTGGVLRLTGVELLLMALASAVAVALTRTPLPARSFVPPVDGADVIGYPPPRQATAARLLTGWLADGPALLLLAVLVTGYLAGVLAVRRRGGRWPAGAVAAWAAGLLLLGWATVGGLGVYARVNLPGHVAARLLLATAVPILLLRGSPVALARAAWGWQPSAAGYGRWRLLSAPEVTLPWFALAVFGWYLPVVFSAVMLRPGGYWLMAAAALTAGLLLFSRSVPPACPGTVPPAAGPGRPPSALERATAPLGVLAMCAAVSLALTWSRLEVGATYFRQLTVPYFRVIGEEQRFAGTVAWLAGGVPVLVLLVVLVLAGRGRPEPVSRPVATAAAGTNPPNNG